MSTPIKPKEFQNDSGHHQPRDFSKKKRKKGFSEDKAANRQARIGFKNYLRELEEDDLDDQLGNIDEDLT
jgi:hypothetical protein